MFYVGQKVVCVDDRSPDLNWEHPVSAGEVYTVQWAGVYQFRCTGRPTLLAVRLFEVIREWPDGNTPLGAYRFRPVVERKTDISIFTKMLTPNERVIERADS
jgi:hypothetical protein